MRLQSKTQCTNNGKILITATEDDTVFNQNSGMLKILKIPKNILKCWKLKWRERDDN